MLRFNAGDWKKIEEAQEFLDELLQRADDYRGERTDSWLDSDSGQSHEVWRDELEQAHRTIHELRQGHED